MSVDSLWTKKDIKAQNQRGDDFFGGKADEYEKEEASVVEYRVDRGIRIALPEVPRRMEYETAGNLLLDKAKSEKEMYELTMTYECRAHDGAWCFHNMMREHYTAGVSGQAQYSMWGVKYPDLPTLEIDRDKTVNVPFGLLKFPPWGAQINLSPCPDPDYGQGLSVQVLAKKKYARQVRGMLGYLKEYIKEHTVYRNKALEGIGRTDPRTGFYKPPVFMAPYAVDRRKVVWAQKEYEALEDEVFGRIRCADLLRQGGEPVGHKVLLAGKPGTGKTLAMLVAMQFCLENNWTAVKCGPDDNIFRTTRFCENINGPKLLTIEDIEKFDFSDAQLMDKMLEMFDGASTKGRELLIMVTTNHPDRIPDKLLRAGRIDTIIFIDELDIPGVERLINVTIPAHQREELDYTVMHSSYEGFSPAYIVRSLSGTRSRSIIRTGQLDQPLATSDFVRSANALRPAWELYQQAGEWAPKEPRIEDLIAKTVGRVMDDRMQSHYVDLSDGEIMIRS